MWDDLDRIERILNCIYYVLEFDCRSLINLVFILFYFILDVDIVTLSFLLFLGSLLSLFFIR